MKILNFFVNYPLIGILFHVLLGILAKFFPQLLTVYYLFLIGYGVIEIFIKQDRINLAGKYAAYFVGIEIVYRMGGALVSWELGKYSCILVMLVGLLFKKQVALRKFPFVIALMLLVPGVFVSLIYGYHDPIYLRKLILQSFSGPLALCLAGMYFYRSYIPKQELPVLLKIAILPLISLVTLLFLGKQLSQVNFYSSSNFDASGGFGPNQVATILGWGIVILIFARLNKMTLTLNKQTDVFLLILILFRGLLTFSRGGILGAFLAVFTPIFVLFFINSEYKKKFPRLMSQAFLGFILIGVTAILANRLTNNFLFYRYQGKSTLEVLYNRAPAGGNPSYFTGRTEVFGQELLAFSTAPLFGIGIGQGTLFREREFNTKKISSHNEISRLLGEQGVFGLIIAIILFIFLPINHFIRYRMGFTRHWFMQFYLIAFLTMMHSGIRLAMPCVALGFAFILIVDGGSKKRS